MIRHVWTNYRILVYGLAAIALLGIHEITALRYFSAGIHPQTLRNTDYADKLQRIHLYQDRERSVARVLNQLYPQDPDAVFLRGLEVEYGGGGLTSACRFYARAVASGVMHSEDMLYMAAVCQEINRAPAGELQQAVDRWRRSHPHSEKYGLQLRFASFQRSGDPARFADAALRSVPYARLQRFDAVNMAVFIQVKGATVNVADLRARLVQAGFVPR
jgi:hypothetical protein